MQRAQQIIKRSIRTIADHPKPGIMFRDITTLMQDAEAFHLSIELLTEKFSNYQVDKIVATEARGFIFGSALAARLKVGFVPVRKPGKLPFNTATKHYQLEYGEDQLEIHCDALAQGERVLLIDDLIATGGTILATVELVEGLGAEVVASGFVIDLPELAGSAKLREKGIECYAICEFEGE